MIDFDELFKTVSPALLQRVGDAMLKGADAKTVKGMFAEEGIDLSEEDIAKVSGGIVAELKKAPATNRELALDELDQVAGGCGNKKKACGE